LSEGDAGAEERQEIAQKHAKTTQEKRWGDAEGALR